MRVLVTRPLEDSLRTAQALAERGHEAVIAPLFKINYLDGPEPPLEGVQAVLATSGNGVRGFARRTARRDIPLFAVGAQTAATARKEGFCYIRDAEGDAAALAALVRAELRREAGALLHAASTNASLALSEILAEAGFDIRTCVVYGIIDAAELPSAAADALRSNTLDAILIYSPRSARLLVDRVKRAGLACFCARMLACCISHDAADALGGVAFAEIRIAARPNKDSMLALLPEGKR
ncbi:MAG TPA: uroporphyrinogen-III synthase [Rhizomicrobium sp.]|jgi:uroporphyrinogen-III synthase|nr:uroporphyrinogen-III synthase [Rhizomicrobium sp.]